MNIEQLMQPKYEVIADYPEQKDSIGFIYEGDGWSKFWWNEMERCPAIFRKLQWWEHRKPEEMPEYVKTESGIVVPVNEWVAVQFYTADILPATAEEYTTQTFN